MIVYLTIANLLFFSFNFEYEDVPLILVLFNCDYEFHKEIFLQLFIALHMTLILVLPSSSGVTLHLKVLQEIS